MKLDQMKKGLFGYKKVSVYQYISQAEEAFSAQLSENVSRYQEMEAQYQTRIAALEAQLQQTQAQLETQRSEPLTIAATLMEATRCAESMRLEAQEKMQKEREEWEGQLAKMQRELDRYHQQALGLQETFGSLLRNLNEQTQDFVKKVEAVQQACPSMNMSLFERKNKVEE